MSESWPEAHLLGVCFVALVGSALGLIGLIGRFGRGTVVPLSLAALLGFTAVTLASAGLPRSLWLAPASLAAICAVFAALRSSWLADVVAAVWKWARVPRLHWAVLLAASPITAMSWAWAVFPVEPDWLAPCPPEHAAPLVAVKWVSGKGAVTDAGRPIPLHTREFNPTPSDLQAADAALFTNGKFAARALRTAPPSDQYNCHGWVFTEGRFGVNSEDVDTILHDNGYQAVADPKPDDLIVYRSSGNITHTGIVRTAVPLLIESKWGRAGRYVHAPGDAPYGGDPAYFHSERAGHLLRGLEYPPTSAEPLTVQAR